jgi:hypothetical protein
MKERLIADKEASMISSKLLGEEYFPKVRKAIRNKDVQGFLNICKEAGIPDKTSKILASTFLQYTLFADDADSWPQW